MLRFTIAGLLLVLVLPAVAAAAPDESPPERVVFVPEGELDVVFGKERTVLLAWAEYLGLKRLAEARPPEVPAPRDAWIADAAYVLEVDGTRVEGSGRLTVALLGDGPTLVRLPISGAGIAEARVDGAAAVVGRDEQGTFLLLEGKGEHELSLRLSMRALREDGDRLRLRGRLPSAPGAFVELRLAGRQRVTAAVPHRTVHPKTDDATLVGVHLGAHGAFDLRWSPRHETAARRALVHADVRQGVLVEDDAIRLEALVGLTVFRSEIAEVSLGLPAGVIVTDVRSPNLLGWSLEEGEDRRLRVRFASPFSGRLSLAVRGEAAFPGAGEMDVPLVSVPAAARLTGRVGLGFGTDLSGRVGLAEGLRRVDPPAEGAGSQAVAAWDFWRPDRRLRVRVERPETTVRASVRTLFQLGETSRVLDVVIFYAPEGGRLYALRPSLPDGFTVTHVLVDDKTEGFTWEETAAGSLRVLLPAGVEPGKTVRLRVRAERPDPGWRDETTRTAEVVLPRVDAGGGATAEGVLGVAAFSDFDVRDADVTGYEPLPVDALAPAGIAALNPVLAYRYRGEPGTGTLRVTRRDPKVVARVVTLVAPSREVVTLRSRVDLTILRAGIRKVRVRVAGELGDRVHVTGDGIRSRRRERVEGADVWTVTFQALRHESASLDLHLEQKADAGDFVVPQVTVLDVADQAGWMAVESSPGLEIRVAEKAGLLEIEGEEVPLPPDHRVGHGFVAAFRWVRAPHALRLGLTRFEERPVLQAVVTDAHLRTRVGEDGLTRTRMELRVRNTDRQFLEVGLPPRSALWSALVNGAPVKPLREEGRVLVPLPKGGGEAAEFPVVLVYETRLEKLSGKGTISLAPPALRVAGTSFRWDVNLPDGFEVVRTAGAFRERRRDAPLLVRILRGMGGLGAMAPMAGSDPGAVASQEDAVMAGQEQHDFDDLEEEPPTADPSMAQPSPKPQGPPQHRRPTDPEPMEDPGEPAAERDLPAGTEDVDFNDDDTPYEEGFYLRGSAWRTEFKGLLSLDIDVLGGGPEANVAAAGPIGRMTVVYRDEAGRKAWSWFLAALTLVLGIVLVRLKLVGSGAWCVVIGALATTAPLIFDAAEVAIWDGVFVGALLCAGVFLAAAIGRKVLRLGVPAALLLAVLLPGTDAVAAPAPGAPATLVVPYDPADPESLERIERVALPHAKYVELWNRAHPDRRIESPRELPVDVVLTGARYTGAVEGESADLVATFGVYLPRDGRVEVALPFSPVALVEAKLDGNPVAVASRSKALVVGVEKAGFHEVTLRVSARAERVGPRGRLKLHVPPLPRSAVDLLVPGTALDVRLPARGGLETTEENGRTRVRTVLGALGTLDLAWGPKGVRRDGQLAVTGASRSLLTVRPGRADLVAETTLTLEGGRLEELVCDLGGGLVVRQVTAPHLLDWVQEDAVLRLRFRPAVTGSVKIVVAGGVETGAMEGRFEVPSVAPRGLLREAGTLGVHAEAGLSIVPAEVRGLLRTGFDAKRFAGLGVRSFGPRRLAYRFARRPATLAVAVAPVRQEILADHRTHLHVADEDVLGRTQATFEVRGRPLHELALSLPAGLRIETVTCDGLRDWWTEDGTEGRQRLVVALQRGFVGKKMLDVVFRPPPAEGEGVDLPNPRPLGADRTSGLVLIGGPSSLELTVQSSEGLRPASAEGQGPLLEGAAAPRFAFRDDGDGYALRVVRKRLEARLRPRVASRLVVWDDKVGVDTFAVFEIQGGGVRSVRLFVPEGEGEDLVWQVEGPARPRGGGGDDRRRGRHDPHALAPGGDLHRGDRARGLRAQDRRRADDDPRDPGGRRPGRPGVRHGREPLRPGRRRGRPRFGPLVLSAGRPAVQDDRHRRLDLQPRVDGAESAWTLGLSFRRFAFEAFDEAVVTMASLVTVIGPEGWSRNRMTYRVLNRSLQHLEVKLPEGAHLEAALVAGEGVKPAARRPGDDLVLIPLKRTALGELATEVVVIYTFDYGTDLKSLAELGSIRAAAPDLVGLALQETYWELRLPEGLDYAFDGNMDRADADIEEVQEAKARKREVSLLRSVETGGNEMQKARAYANRYRTAVEQDKVIRGAISNLQSRLAAASAEEKRVIASKLAEMESDLAKNFADNLAQQAPQTRQGVEELRRHTRQSGPEQTVDVPRAGVPILGTTPVVGQQLQRSRELLGKKQEVARGKAGLLGEQWTANTMQTEDPSIEPAQQDGQVLVLRSANNVDLLRGGRILVAGGDGGTLYLHSTINPVDLGRLRTAYGRYRLPVLDDVTSGQEDGSRDGLDNARAGRASLAANDPRRGAFFNDGRHGDIRSRTENLFRGPGGEVPPNMRTPEDPAPPSSGDPTPPPPEEFDVEIAQGATIADRRQDRERGQGPTAGGGGGGGAVAVGGGVRFVQGGPPAAKRAGVLSLDVPLPAGGRVFRFRKENGGPELEISIADPATGRTWRGVLWLVLAVGAFLGLRELDRRRPFRGFRAAVAWTLALVCMLVYGTVVPSLLVMIVAFIAFGVTRWGGGARAVA
jgi:hypothetical protein